MYKEFHPLVAPKTDLDGRPLVTREIITNLEARIRNVEDINKSMVGIINAMAKVINGLHERFDILLDSKSVMPILDLLDEMEPR